MTQHATLTAQDVVLAYHSAWTSGDVATAMTYVADDIECKAPGGDISGKADYQGFIAAFAPDVTGLTDIGSVVQDDHVALFYYPETAATTTAPAAEYFTVANGKIVSSVLIFDRMSFLPPS